MAIRRAFFERLGGFQEGWRYAEDIELSGRAERAGARSAFVPAAGVRHHKRSTLGAFAGQIFQFGAARVRLSRHERRPIEPAYWLPALWAAAFYASVAAGFSRGGFAWAPAAALALPLAAFGVETAARLGSFAALLWAPLVFAAQLHAYAAGLLCGIVRGGGKYA